MKYFKVWVSKNHPQLIENYPEGGVTLWEHCCRYHKEVIKEYRQDEHAIKTISQECDVLRRALKGAAKQMSHFTDCPFYTWGWEKEAECASGCRSGDDESSICWLLYFKENENE